MKPNHWYIIKNQSLSLYARAAGFDLSMYQYYSNKVKEELRAKTILEAMREIRAICSGLGIEIENIERGIYVISLSLPLSVKYPAGRSQVLYVGVGHIFNRIKQHFGYKLFQLMLDLSGANFNFYFAKPTLQGTSDYYRHVEHLMLDYFSGQYGDGSNRTYPILNKNSGSNRAYHGGTEWWKKPLKSTGKNPKWELFPTNYSKYKL